MRISIRVMMLLMIVALMSDGASAYQRSNRSRKVRELVEAAAAGKTQKVIQLLNSGVNVNATFEMEYSELSGKSALSAAALGGHSGLVEELIKRGANVNLKLRSGTTALISAAHGGDKRTIEALLRAGADVNVTVVSPHAGELTPLSITMHADHPQRYEVARILLAAKAEVNPKGRFFISPLMHALEDLEMVKLLIEHGADVNQKNFRGATALMGAAVGKDPAVVRFLIEKGADAKARDQDGHTARMAAESEQSMLYAEERAEIIKILRRAEAGIKGLIP